MSRERDNENKKTVTEGNSNREGRGIMRTRQSQKEKITEKGEG